MKALISSKRVIGLRISTQSWYCSGIIQFKYKNTSGICNFRDFVSNDKPVKGESKILVLIIRLYARLHERKILKLMTSARLFWLTFMFYFNHHSLDYGEEEMKNIRCICINKPRKYRATKHFIQLQIFETLPEADIQVIQLRPGPPSMRVW